MEAPIILLLIAYIVGGVLTFGILDWMGEPGVICFSLLWPIFWPVVALVWLIAVGGGAVSGVLTHFEHRRTKRKA